MPSEKIELTFKWENSQFFKLTSKEGSNEVDIIKLEENGCIGDLWGGVATVVQTYISHILNRIGNEMKEV